MATSEPSSVVFLATVPGTHPAFEPGLKLASEIVFAAGAIAGVIGVWHYRHSIVSSIRLFFSEAGSPFDLAVFRIVFYSTALVLLETPDAQVERFAELPRDLVLAPTGTGPIVRYLPISATLVQVAYVVLLISTVLAAVGFLTRIASIAFVLSLFYFLTIPQLYGKIDHQEHIVVWVGALLAVSRTADVWSIDALLRARRDARLRRPLVPRAATAYSRPLRVTWLFLAITYLGPGLWKYRSTGLQWASPSNMRAILYDKWYEVGSGYRPILQLDKHGVLLVLGALGTLTFEIGFVFLIWNRYTRLVAAVMGAFFHTVTWLTLDISFWAQLVIYVSFIEWTVIACHAYRRRSFPLIFAYDAGCGPCRTTATVLARLALPCSVQFTSAQELAAENGQAIPGLAALRSEIHLITSKGSFRGFAAYRRVAWRIPVFWPIIPLLYVPPVSWSGERLYRALSRRRHCAVGTPVAGDAPPAVPGERGKSDRWTTVPTFVGGVILAFGVAAIGAGVNSWPFSLYPTFAGLTAADHSELRIEENTLAGGHATVSIAPCFTWMPSERYAGLVYDVMGRSRQTRSEALLSFLSAASKTCPSLIGRTRTFSFYWEAVATTPAYAGRLLGQELLLRERVRVGSIPP
jgi:predicted DCC family thiol-disulfide oxidoreductase YuxK